MSMMAQVSGVEITDLDCLKKVCDKHDGLVFEQGSTEHGTDYKGRRIVGVLKDLNGGAYSNYALLVETGGKGCGIVVDNDSRYSSISKRFGKDCGRLIRDYSCARLKKGMARHGGMLTSSKVGTDGTVTMKFAVNG
jgi:hypothetical protein